MEEQTPVLGYWKMRAKAHSIRMLLEYLHVPYCEDIFTPETFFNDHKEISHMARNLPYLKDKDIIIFDLLPILTYLARKYNRFDLFGHTAQDQAKTDMFHWKMIHVFQKTICCTFWHMESAERNDMQRRICQEIVIPVMAEIESQIKDGDWFLGYLSISDFCIAELIYLVNEVFPGELTKFPKTNNIEHMIREIPELKALEERPEIKELLLLPSDVCMRKRLG